MAKVTNSISLSGSGGSSIIVVANYSALPDPTTVSGEFYWVSNSQGTKWLPGSLGGTYYNSGLYYSNGTTWEFMNVPYQATQLEVDTGTNTDKFVTPKTFNDSAQLANKANIASPTFTGTVTSPAIIVSSETALTISYFDASKNIKSLDTSTYPNLTELTYLKGVTSSIQTQIDNKVSAISPTLTGLTTLTGTTQTGSSNTGILSLTQTWNTTGSPTAIILNVTNTASGAVARLLDLQTGGVSRFAVDKLGGMSATTITSTGDINTSVTGSFTWGSTNSRATMFSPSNGIIRFSNAAGTDFSRLQFGLTNSTAPAIKRNGTALNFRLADDSADCPITASNGTFSGNIIASGTTSVVRLKGYTVATLPSGTQGDTAFVTDALAPTSLNTVVGGGAITVTVFYNGTNWIVQ